MDSMVDQQVTDLEQEDKHEYFLGFASLVGAILGVELVWVVRTDKEVVRPMKGEVNQLFGTSQKNLYDFS